MADPPRYPGSDDDRGTRRWVMVVVIVAVIVALLIVALRSIGGGGEHGPGRHARSSGQAAPAGVVAAEHIPPEGGHGGR